NISHELRTPLSLISGPLERLTGNSGDIEEIDMMKRNVQRLHNLVDQLMDFQKIESEKMQPNFREKDVVALAKSVLMNFRDMARQKNVTLLFESDRGSITTMADQDMLEKILFNLLSNAFKYTSEQGSIKASVF